MTDEEKLTKLINEFNIIHNNKYDYSKAIYVNTRTKILIKCPIHDYEFMMNIYKHKNEKQGCKKCSGRYSFTTKEYIDKANIVHNFKYRYDKTIYTKNSNKIKIYCYEHGYFEQLASDHVNQKKGCMKCGGRYSPTTNEFIKKVNIVHNFKYNYELVEYINNNIKIKIICPNHGIFEQKPAKHLIGKGCPKCSYRISRNEIKWLDSLNILPENRQLYILNYHIDGYDPLTNTIYEYHGDYWHGNPKKFSPCYWNQKAKKFAYELYQETLNRKQKLIQAGYNVIEIWEWDFIKN